jgi:apolipoprotein N-acyltransferase
VTPEPVPHATQITPGGHALLAGLAHAVLMMLAYPPVGVWPAALVAIVPLVWAGARLGDDLMRLTSAGIARRPVLRHAAQTWLLVTLGVLPFYAFQQHWLIKVTAVGYAPVVAGMAMFAGGFVWALAELRARLPRLPMTLLVPLLWGGLEVFRGEVAFSGYPWFLLAHPLIDAWLLPLPATVLGTYFVSFLTALLAGGVADMALTAPTRRRAALVGISLWVVAVGGSLAAPRGSNDPAGEVLRIAIVQTNVPQDNKISWTIEQKLADFERFLELTYQAALADPRPDVIIWPESMFPELLDPQAVAEQRRVGLVYNLDTEAGYGDRLSATAFHDNLVELQRRTGVAMLIGAVAVDGLRISEGQEGGVRFENDAQYNSAFLIAGGRVDPRRYDKLRLTPFGEVMPYISAWPWLERQLLWIGARGMKFDLSPGSEPRHFEVTTASGTVVAVATPICFEVTKPRLNRLLLGGIARERPRLLVNSTNDGWFDGYDGGRQQHLQISRWRSLEFGLPMVRAANTGISAWIDARGRVVKAGVDGGGRSQVDGILTADLRPTLGGTIYSRIGEVFGWSVLGAAGGVILLGLSRRRAAG